MLFDTGSSLFWIPSNKCETTICKNHSRYKKTVFLGDFNQGKSPLDIEVLLFTQYISGKVKGKFVTENVKVGDLVVKKQPIGLADNIDIQLMEDVIWDGILGLSYAVPEDPALPLFDTIILRNLLKNRQEKNQFSYYLGHNRGSVIFGGADMKYKRSMGEEFVWSPVIEKEYWTISLKEVRKEWRDKKPSFLSKTNNQNRLKKIVYEKGMKTIVDTGTYLIYGPHEETEVFILTKKFLADIYVDKCTEKKKMPNVVFKFKGENQKDGTSKMVEVTMTPDDYILHYKQEAKDDCVVGIAPDYEDTDGWTLGQVFLKAFYTVFDRDNDRIGFVRANINYDPVEPSENSKQNNKKFKTMFTAKTSSTVYDPSFTRVNSQTTNLPNPSSLSPNIDEILNDLKPKNKMKDEEPQKNPENTVTTIPQQNQTMPMQFMPQMGFSYQMPYYPQYHVPFYNSPPSIPMQYQFPFMANLHQFKRKNPLSTIPESMKNLTRDELVLIKKGEGVKHESENLRNFTERLKPVDFINFRNNFSIPQGLKDLETIDFRNFIFKHNKKEASTDLHFPYEKPKAVENDDN